MQKNKRHLTKLSVMFVVMILLTLLSFYLVQVEWMTRNILLGTLLFFAMVQVLIQLVLFMDIKEKEGRYRITSLAAGGFIALLTIFFLSILKM